MAADSQSELRHRYLAAMGIDVWAVRQSAGDVKTPAAAGSGRPPAEADTAEPGAAAAQPRPTGALDLPALRARVEACTECGLHRSRDKTVFGTGPASADWLFVGEAPGREENRQGLAFVGRAGQLLNAMLDAIGLEREEVYIANVLKCWPPQNRDPAGEEVVRCEPYLRRQVELIQPRIIVAMGRFAAQSLLKSGATIGSLRGRVHPYGDAAVALIVTYHPAFLLRSPLEKRKAWQDLQLAVRTLRAVAD